MAEEIRGKTEWFLPELLQGTVPRPSKPGVYEDFEDLVKAIAADLMVGESMQVTAERLTAIPTPWARALLFANALVDYKTETTRGHPLHAQVLDEWKGLLGLFCLRAQFGAHLETKRLNLQEMGGHALGRTLTELLPQPASAWQEFDLLYANQKLVGCTSPLSLFFTPPIYDPPVEWFRTDEKGRKRLMDPLDYFLEHGGVRQFAAEIASLARYVDFALSAFGQDVLPAEAGTTKKDDRYYHGRLTTLLGDWSAKLKAALGRGSAEIMASIPEATEKDALDVAPVYAPFTMGWGREKFRSDILLATEKYKGKNDAPIVVCQAVWETHPNWVVHGAQTVGAVLFPEGTTGGRLTARNNSVIAHTWVNVEKAFLTDRVLRLKDSPLSSNAMHPDDDGFVPPLRKEILDYFSRDELAKYFRWIPVTRGVQVELTVPIRSSGGRVQSIRISKHYEPSEVVEIAGKALVLAVWPNFQAEGWTYNYGFTQNDIQDLVVAPISSIRVDHRAEGLSVWGLGEPLTGYQCSTKTGIEGSDPIGLILPDPVRFPRPSPSGLIWDIAYDFGTSNTSVAYRCGSGMPSPLATGVRHVHLTRLAESVRAEKDELLTRSFQPCVPSRFDTLNEKGIGSSTCNVHHPGTKPTPVYDAVYMPLELLGDWGAPLYADGSTIRSQLKWSAIPSDRTLISTFLQHLLILTAAEARAEGAVGINVHWSYPAAFLDWMIVDFTSAWGSIVEETRKGIGMTLDQKSRTTEGVAVCRHFRQERFARMGQNALVTVDLGGRTTDIAVWHGGLLRTQASLLLSPSVVAEFYAKKRASFDTFLEAGDYPESKRTEWRSQITKHTEWEGLLAYTALNQVLRESGVRVRDGVRKLGGAPASAQLKTSAERGQQDLRRASNQGGDVSLYSVRSLVFFTFAGILHYIGICLRGLLREQVNAGLSCELWLAGNATKLREWVADPMDVTPRFMRVLQDAARPVGLDPLLMDVSGCPKQEVVRGLLAPELPVDSLSVQATHIIGETGYRAGSAVLPWHYDLGSKEGEDLLSEEEIEVPDELPELSRFLATYNREAAGLKLLQLNDVSIRSIGDAVKGKLRAAKSAAHEKQSLTILNPLFVEEVRAVIEDHFLGIRRG